MSQPEEPEFQWLEDALVQVTQSVFALGAAVITIFVDLVFTVCTLFNPRD